ncbi:molybdopterin-dependent oxidoreductase [Hydrogenophaga sp.]|uniref:molybdopterin-dependent oxidoreductase n=1 Tax=Hydrogenophaga sp. TaxID=1904254 RepID=UPI003F6BD17E
MHRRNFGIGTSLALAFWASAPMAQAPAPDVTEHLLRVGGAVQTPLVLTRVQLEALPWRDYAESREVQQDGRTVKLAVHYQGFPLRDLIDRAGLSPNRQALRRAVLLLTARDGYRVSFSWGELYNSALGDGVILVRSQDGRDLIAADGLPALRSLQDTRSGPRHVRWLERIEVRVVGD